MSTAETYVTGAYCVVFALVLIYVVIMALKLQRLEREVSALEPAKPAVLAPEREKVEAGIDG
jgi:CcmD family protein